METDRAKLPILNVPAGAWAVGVSGGVDSVAMLEILRGRGDLKLHVVHLDHEARGEESAADADFVRDLAAKWDLACTVARLTDLQDAKIRSEKNLAARFRLARLAIFRREIDAHGLAGVILAHHADDQAETVFQRLLRGSGPTGLTGMVADATVAGVRMLRPMLSVSKRELRELLVNRGIPWREDPSNTKLVAQRNRVRKVLNERPELTEAMLELAKTCGELTLWLRDHTPMLGESFSAEQLVNLPTVLAREAARRWLGERGGVDVEIPPDAAERLIAMASDAATPRQQHFPGSVLVRRKGGKIFVQRGDGRMVDAG